MQTKRPTPITIQAGATLHKANSKQALAVVKRKILNILFCFVLIVQAVLPLAESVLT